MFNTINPVSSSQLTGFAPRIELASIVQLAASSIDSSRIPACAVSCITERCSLTNKTCICEHQGYESPMDGCMFHACRLSDAIFSKNITATFCELPVRDKGLRFKLVNFLLGGMAVGMVFMRIFYRRYMCANRKLEADDWTGCVALMVGVPAIILQVGFLEPRGLGRDIWTLDIPTLLQFGQYFFTMEILYLTLITLLKVSLCLFYLNIFPGRIIRQLLWWTVAFHAVAWCAFFLNIVLQCTPVSYNWTKFDDNPAIKGHCINLNSSGWVNGGIGIAADIWLLAMPMTQLKKLSLHWKKKLAAGIMFLTGGIVTVVSLLRLKSLSIFANTWNPTWNHWDVEFWSTVEVTVGFICTSLPALRLVLMHLFPQVFQTDPYGSSNNVYKRKSSSNLEEGITQDGDGGDFSQSNLILPDGQVVPKDEGGASAGESHKIRVRTMQAVPSDDENEIELVEKENARPVDEENVLKQFGK